MENNVRLESHTHPREFLSFQIVKPYHIKNMALEQMSVSDAIPLRVEFLRGASPQVHMSKLNLKLGSILEILKSAGRRHGPGDDPRLKAPQARRSSNLQRRSVRLGSSSIPDRFCSGAVIKEESDAFSFGHGFLQAYVFERCG